MKNDLMKLLEAQKIDLDIDQLYKHKKEYPQQIENLKKEIEDLEHAIENITTGIAEREKNRRTIEEEIKAEQEILVQKDKRLLETKTNKEYTAVQHEIELARERIDSLETEDLELMTELDEMVPKQEETEKNYKVTKKSNRAKIKEIKTKFESIESDIKVLEHKRKRTLKDINSRALTVYNRLRKGKSGLAVSVVDPVKHSCKGCFKQLPPQKVLDIRRGDKIIFCENCGRIIVWDTENE